MRASLIKKMSYALMIFVGSESSLLAAEQVPNIQLSIEVVDRIAEMLPESIRSRGTLKVATISKHPPHSYIFEGRKVGIFPDMITAAAQVLGLKAEINQLEFAAILTGLQGGRYDVGMGGFYLRSDRLEIADFMVDGNGGSVFHVREDSDFVPQRLVETCGKRIGIVAGTSGVPAMAAAKERCEAQSDDAPTVSNFANESEALVALGSRRIDAFYGGHELAVVLKQVGQPFKQSQQIIGGPAAMAFARNADSEQLTLAVQAAYMYLIEEGIYDRLHKAWGTDFEINHDPRIYRKGDTPPEYTYK